jgi:glycerophosphoryl diester phosphodiesterase
MRVGLILLATAFLAGCATRPANQPTVAPTAQAPAALDIVAAMDCLRERNLAVVSAHRGGYAPGFPENAIETFTYTTSRIPALLETDIRQTRDRTLILMHDETLDRTTTGTGDIASKDYGELTKLQLKDDAGMVTPFGVPLLSAALEWGKDRAILKLDVKRTVDMADVLALVRRMNADHRVVVIVYTLEDAIRVHSMAPGVMISVSIDSPDDLDQLIQKGVDPRQILAFTGTRSPNPALYAALRSKGVEPIFGTLGRPAESLDTRYLADGNPSEFIDLVNAGVAIIATNKPVEVQRALVAAGKDGSACLAPQR